MKKYIAVLTLFSVSVFLHSEDLTNSNAFAISIAPLTLASLMIFDNNVDNESVNIDDIWFSISLNLGNNRKEYDLFISKYPHIFNIGVEQRNFLNDTFSGFFYGPFISIDYSYLEIIDDYPAYSTAKYESDDVYGFIGFRLGGELGYRFIIFKEIGLSLKIGLGLPIYYVFGIDNDRNYQDIYLKNMLFNTLFLGFKIDFKQ